MTFDIAAHQSHSGGGSPTPGILTVPLRFAGTTEYLQHVLSEFGDVLALQTVGWESLWKTLSDSVFKKHGSEMAEIGSTWLPSLVGMNSLRPFSPMEVEAMGTGQSFLKAAWDSTRILPDTQTWSIPWTGDVRVIYYWRDMLEQAQIDPVTAFDSPAHLVQTLTRLEQAGYAHPWVVETTRNSTPMQYAASWMWNADGDYISNNGKQVAFVSAPALEGLTQYFELMRFYPLEAGLMGEEQANTWFAERKSAVTISGPWLLERAFNTVHADEADPHKRLAKIGVAFPPGPAFVGGTNLVIMAHLPAPIERKVVDLCIHLVSEQSQRELMPILNGLPVRKAFLHDPFYTDDQHRSVMVQAMNQGRAMRNVARWGIIEERLMDTFVAINQDIINQSAELIPQIVDKRLKTLAARLNMVLSQ